MNEHPVAATVAAPAAPDYTAQAAQRYAEYRAKYGPAFGVATGTDLFGLGYMAGRRDQMDEVIEMAGRGGK